MRSRRIDVRSVRSAAVAALVLSAGAGVGLPARAAEPGREIGLAIAPPVDASKLFLRTGEVDTVAGEELAAVFAQRGALAGKRYVIQLDGPMTPERRAALVGAGVMLGDYLPTNAWVATLDQADPVKASALGFVRWHSEFRTAWKVDPAVGRNDFANEDRKAIVASGQAALTVHLFKGASVDEINAVRAVVAGLEDSEVYYEEDLGGAHTMSVRIGLADLGAVAGHPAVQFVEESPDITLRNSTNRWIVQSNVPGVTPLYDRGIRGEGQILGILDSRVNSNHCSFSDPSNPIGPSHRKIVAYNASLGSASHGTHCAGTAVGDNGVNDDTRGVAYMGKLAFGVTPSFSETSMLAALNLHHSQGARVHTNSWGNDNTTSYDGLARGIDVYSHANEDGLVLFAVTNTSTLKNPENAKNCLAVGASQDNPSQGAFCSGGTGPTSDQRRKPEIYAPGCSTLSASSSTSCGVAALTGTSMACPAVAGTAMLVRQYYTEGFYPSGVRESADAFTPSGALLRATLLNSAVDMTSIAGFPSNQEGWGRVLADNALYFDGDSRKLIAEDVRNANGLTTGQTVEQAVNVVGSGEPLKITLVYTDAPASSGSALATVNDLDLEVVSPGGDVYRGNVFSGGLSATGGTKDARNTVEQVLIAAPAAGPWTVRIVGAAVNSGTQGYALVATGDVSLGPAPLTIAASGMPTLVAPGEASSFSVEVNPRDDSLVPGSAKLFYRTGPGVFAEAPLVPDSGTTYTAILPSFPCGAAPEFYVAAEGVATGVKTAPAGAPSNLFSSIVGAVQVSFDDDMETDAGWTVGAPGDLATTGVWVRADPVGTAAQPEDDVTPAPGVNCWVTGNGTPGGAAGANDVDGGATTLTSPVFDASASPEARVSYWRWYSNSSGAGPNQDVFRVEISNNGGSTWSPLETVGPSGPETAGGWNFKDFRIADFVAPTAQVRLRFIADDISPGSVVEAAIDDVRVAAFECEDVATCAADLDGDGQVGASDLATLLGAWGTGVSPADLDGDGAVNASDLAAMLGAWGPCR